jgi:nicotinate-nucleotide pyrophosphorylase (carboxylating)
VNKEFRQIDWDETLQDDFRQIIRLAIREDLDRTYDWTTAALVPSESCCRTNVVARQAGVVAGLSAGPLALEETECHVAWSGCVQDGDRVESGETLAEVSGPARHILTAERILLNVIGHLSGIATLTSQFVDAVSGTSARIYDTRKTTPGWRRLEKYAVRAGGGMNHRTGLFDAILIKDNHLAIVSRSTDESIRLTAAGAVHRARQFIRDMSENSLCAEMIVEVEVDSLDQLDDALTAGPDIILLDNMSNEELREAVARRNRIGSQAQLEASGGVRLDTVHEIAETGVDRISVGAITHSAPSFDVGLDWLDD